MITTDLPCPDCRQPLADAEIEPNGHFARCICGLLYGLDVIAGADSVLWLLVTEQRLFHRDGDVLIMTSPPEAIRERYPEPGAS